MFSDHLRKLDQVSNNKLFLAAGLLVIVCQLVAMAMVAGGQVEKAQLRDSRLAVERTALASCMETSVGAGRHGCVVQARSVHESVAPVSSVVQDVVSVAAGEYGNAEGRSLSQMVRQQAGLAGASSGSSGASSMMSVAFGTP
ncbi:MAG: hypothetical protein V4772_13960 [Pseudomonadota bacterium]